MSPRGYRGTAAGEAHEHNLPIKVLRDLEPAFMIDVEKDLDIAIKFLKRSVCQFLWLLSRKNLH